MSRHRLAFCSFACPDSWEPVAPLTWAAQGSGLVRFHAHLGQSWLLGARSASEVADDLKQLWLALDDTLEIEHAAPISPTGPGDGWGAVVRMRDEYGNVVRRLAHLLVLGPVACHLMVDRPLDLGEELDVLANEIAMSLRFEAVELLEQATSAPVLEAGDGPGTVAFGEPLAVPTLCAQVPVPSGWERTTAAHCEATLSGPGMQLTVRRPIGAGDDLTTWLGAELTRLALEPEARLQRWEHGELRPRRVEYAAIDVLQRVGGGTWVKPVYQRVLAAGLREQQFFEIELAVTSAPLEQAASVFRGVVDRMCMLPPEQWQTPLAESWLPLTLRGGWRPQGDGVYVKVEDGMLVLHLACVENRVPIETTRPKMPDIIDMVRAGAPLLAVDHEEEAVGSWRGLEGYRYALDASFSGLGSRSVRAVALQAGRELYSCRITGEIASQAQALFLEILEGLRIPGMKER